MAKPTVPFGNRSYEPATPSVSQEDIEVAAYHNWIKRGRPIGDDQKDWFEARKILEKGASGKRPY